MTIPTPTAQTTIPVRPEDVRPLNNGDLAPIAYARGFGVDLDKASGRDHHLLPVPAVYIIDTQSVIRFTHWDADYKKRLEPTDLLAAARRVVGH